MQLCISTHNEHGRHHHWKGSLTCISLCLSLSLSEYIHIHIYDCSSFFNSFLHHICGTCSNFICKRHHTYHCETLGTMSEWQQNIHSADDRTASQSSSTNLYIPEVKCGYTFYSELAVTALKSFRSSAVVRAQSCRAGGCLFLSVSFARGGLFH